MEESKVRAPSIKSGKKVIVGSAELNYKRDAMEIQPLFQENGISNHIINSY